MPHGCGLHAASSASCQTQPKSLLLHELRGVQRSSCSTLQRRDGAERGSISVRCMAMLKQMRRGGGVKMAWREWRERLTGMAQIQPAIALLSRPHSLSAQLTKARRLLQQGRQGAGTFRSSTKQSERHVDRLKANAVFSIPGTSRSSQALTLATQMLRILPYLLNSSSSSVSLIPGWRLPRYNLEALGSAIAVSGCVCAKNMASCCLQIHRQS